MTADTLDRSLARIAKLQGEVREVHLQAHLEQIALLSADQISRYNQLRGYSGDSAGDPAHSRGHH